MKYVSAFFLLIILILNCDNRTDTTNQPHQAAFQADMVAVKDSTGYGNVVDIAFKRDAIPFDNAVITVADQIIPRVASGRYRATSPSLSLPYGLTSVLFRSTADNYSSTVSFEIPGPFQIQEINPRSNSNGGSVLVRWGLPQAQDNVNFFISVVGKNYQTTSSRPMAYAVGSDRSFNIPDTAFEDDSGYLVPDIYFVYVGAYTRGFMAYWGEPCPIPSTLPLRT